MVHDVANQPALALSASYKADAHFGELRPHFGVERDGLQRPELWEMLHVVRDVASDVYTIVVSSLCDELCFGMNLGIHVFLKERFAKKKIQKSFVLKCFFFKTAQSLAVP